MKNQDNAMKLMVFSPAVKPNNGGNAPGIAPTKTDKGVIGFKGV